METYETNTPQAIRTQKHANVFWIDAENPSAETFAELEKGYHLHPVHLKESTQQVQHRQVEHEDHYLFFVLHVPLYDPQHDKILVNQVGVFLGKDFLITIRTGKIPALTKLFDQCEHELAQKDEYFKRGPAYVLHILINQILDDISNMTENVSGELDSLEDLVFSNTGSDAQRIGKVRQKIVKLGRIIGPKKLILEDLTQRINVFTGQSMSKYFSNNTKTVNKLWEVIEEAKETVEIYKDADFTTSTEQTNKILAILTLIFTFTIPITVVGTLYGMNVPVPGGLATGAWTWLGRYTTFGTLVALSVTAAVVMYLYFRRKKWF